ncbi:hypothetical protein THRCLA_06804 [Thraustotheca clavata]|uniref:C2 domain-containing protein n=1 Tax=Thraustotheca clavata TaxID=74557 RepID=A0A1V9ZJ40_9STRA|nr:hypothetical protein THRCLA_06804 [Thraustotheca clavata]
MVATTEPTRRLRIEIFRATNLPPSHPDAATSDPYVFIQLGKNQWQSQVARKTLNPSWHDQVCEFFVSDSESTSDLELKIWINDLDTIALEDALGSISLPLEKWTEGWVSTFVVSVWENQRLAPGVNRWSKDYLSTKCGDRMPWSGPENAANLFKDAVPPIPINYQAKGPWKFLLNHGDINGWMYATSFKGPWKKTMAKHHTVRCREWTNEYVLCPTTTINPTPSQKDFEF